MTASFTYPLIYIYFFISLLRFPARRHRCVVYCRVLRRPPDERIKESESVFCL